MIRINLLCRPRWRQKLDDGLNFVGCVLCAPFLLILVLVLIASGIVIGLPYLVLAELRVRLRRCRVCHQRGVRLFAREDAFYMCLKCNARYMRQDNEWKDASDSQFDQIYNGYSYRDSQAELITYFGRRPDGNS